MQYSKAVEARVNYNMEGKSQLLSLIMVYKDASTLHMQERLTFLRIQVSIS